MLPLLPSASGGTLTSSLFNPTLGEIYDEFERDLRRWRERYRDRPELELQRLLLLALEIEQLVTVAYRNELMRERIEEQDLPRDLKEVFAHSLAWQSAADVAGSVRRFLDRPGQTIP